MGNFQREKNFRGSEWFGMVRNTSDWSDGGNVKGAECVCAHIGGKLAVPASQGRVHRGFFAISAVPKGVPEGSGGSQKGASPRPRVPDGSTVDGAN